MADAELPEEIERVLDDETGKVDETETTPSYKMVGQSRIVVSKALGKIRKSRVAASEKRIQDYSAAWDEALAYAENDQMSHRAQTGGKSSGNRSLPKRTSRTFSQTENLVYSNLMAIVPALYMKNPEVSFDKPKLPVDLVELAAVIEDLVDQLFSRDEPIGLGLKSKVRRGIAVSFLTNKVWMQVGYTKRQDASEQAFEDLQTLSDQYATEKDGSKLKEIEGQLKALEDKVAFLRPSGPWIKLKMPSEVLIDAYAQDPGGADSSWLGVYEYINTDFLNAVYGERQADGTYKSIYKPTHVLSSSTSEEDQQFSLFDKNTSYRELGYDDEYAYRNGCRTKCIYIYDKTTRRLELWDTNDYKWPIWVWDDPNQLQDFFGVYDLTPHVTLDTPYSLGEVSYYLDQQDHVNEIASMQQQSLQWGKYNFVYNSSVIDRDTVDRIIKGDNNGAVGIKLPEGTKLSDHLQPLQPAYAQLPQLFDRSAPMEAIGRISSVGVILQNQQFKTNTTNKAIESYDSTQQVRLGEQTDMVEDWLSRVAWAIAQMCLMYMSMEEVSRIVGYQATAWRNLSREDLTRLGAARLIAGSTTKPTSTAKKAEALELAQALGQFVNAAPGVVLSAMLKVIESAFDEVVIRPEDWQALRDAITFGDENKLSQAIDQLPPPAKAALGQALSQGVPLQQAMQEIQAQLNQTTQPQQEPAPNA